MCVDEEEEEEEEEGDGESNGVGVEHPESHMIGEVERTREPGRKSPSGGFAGATTVKALMMRVLISILVLVLVRVLRLLPVLVLVLTKNPKC